MKCRFCGKEFEPGKQSPYNQYCSQKCCNRFAKGLFHLRPPSENKTLSEWTAEARECGLDYGNYRVMREMGKTYAELKAQAARYR